jgi:hypothetical protein
MRTRKGLPVGHPSPNRSEPSKLNPDFIWSEFPEKKLQLVDISILSILLNPEPGCHNVRMSGQGLWAVVTKGYAVPRVNKKNKGV